jgi:hypothetical protein
MTRTKSRRHVAVGTRKKSAAIDLSDMVREECLEGWDGRVRSPQGNFAMMALARATTSGLMASAVRPDGTLTWRSRECLPVQTISSA